MRGKRRTRLARSAAGFGLVAALASCGDNLSGGLPDARQGADARTGDDACTTCTPANAYLKASNTDAGDRFGLSVAISADGSRLAIGAAFEDSAATGIDGDSSDDSAPDAGAVYVWARAGDAWVQEAYVKALNADAGDRFGEAVALSADGSRLVVGARSEASAATGVNGDASDDSAGGSGAVYIFLRTGTAWTQEAYIKATNTGPADFFGAAVALSGAGDMLAVGAFGEDSAAVGVDGDVADNSAPDAGAVYTYRRAGTTWASDAYLKASNTDEEDQFGQFLAVSADGGRIAVGSIREDGAATTVGGDDTDDSAIDAGAAYVFVASAGTWIQEAYVKPSNLEIRDAFGCAVALSADGSVLAVGAHEEASAVVGDPTDNTADGAGAVYTYSRSGGIWSLDAYVKSPHPRTQAEFGYRLALSGAGDRLAVSAHLESSASRGIDGDPLDESSPQSGAAYLFDRNGTTWSLRHYVKATNTGPNDRFAESLAFSDNLDVLALGATGEGSAATGANGDASNDDAPTAGAVYVYQLGN